MSVAPFPMATLTGAPFERGVQYGTQLRDRVRRSTELYGGALKAFGLPEASKTRLTDRFAGKIAEFDEAYVEEMRGIAKGAEVDFTDIVLINARTEIVALARAETGAPDPDELDDGCTGAIVFPDRSATGRLLHGQTWDWRAECADTGVVLRVRRENGPDFLSFVEAGGLARSGLNEAGISITANYLECERDFTQTGVPLGLIRRKVLEQEHFAMAVKHVACTPKSCSNNMMIASSAGFGIDFECAPDEAFPIHEQDGMIVHANHWISPTALSKLRDTGLPYVPESVYRDRRVRGLLEAKGRPLTLEDLKEAFFDDFLSPYSVCRPPRPGTGGNLTATVATVILDSSRGVMEIAPLPALNREFSTYALRDEDMGPAKVFAPASPASAPAAAAAPRTAGQTAGALG